MNATEAAEKKAEAETVLDKKYADRVVNLSPEVRAPKGQLSA